MDDGARVKLIEIADALARREHTMAHVPNQATYLRDFRKYYRHLAATVDLAVNDSGIANGVRKTTDDELQ